MNVIEVLITIVGSLGGLELLKWLFTRRENKRVAEAKADSDEFHYLKERIQFADKQLLEKEQRFVEQTALLRDANRMLLEKQEKMGELQSKNSELLAERRMKLCEKKGCRDRQPQSGY